MSLTRFNLTCVGVWPDSRCSKKQKVMSKCAFMIFLIVVGYSIVVVQTTKLFTSSTNLDMVVDILSIADFPIFICMLKLVILRVNFKGKIKLLQMRIKKIPSTSTIYRTKVINWF